MPLSSASPRFSSPSPPRVSLDPQPHEIITLLPAPGPTTPPAPEATLQPLVLPRPQPAPTPAPEARPAPPARSAPVSDPTPPRPPRSAPPKTPAATPTVATASGKRISQEEFIKQYGPRTPAPTSAPKPRPAAPAPQIDSAAIIGAVTLAPGGATASADPDFIAALVAQLQAAFATTGPWPENLAATLSFKIGADGRLHALKVTTSSRHAPFDAAAQAACRQLRLTAVPASATAAPYELTFRSIPQR